MAIDIYSIANELTRDIVNLDILPGTKIIEDDLALRFSVSRTPIRQVIMYLKGIGLLEVMPKIGTYVTKIDAEDARSQIFIRKAVEKEVIKEVIEQNIELDYSFLYGILDEQKNIISKEHTLETGKAFFHADNAFHKAIFTAANKGLVWKEIHSEAICFNRIRIMANLREPAGVNQVYEEHLELLSYIKEKKLDEALALVDRHVETGVGDLEQVKHKYPEYFK